MVADGASSSDASASPLSAVCSFWRELDLEGLRPKLDEVGLKVAELQEESMQHRRKLAESTKEFKRNNEAVNKTVGPLMKQYQEEIDRLSKRAKHGETAFLDLYQKLYEAPDPAPALALAFETASRATDLEAQCRKMAQELAEYRAESAQIKNQDLTVRKLEERVRQLEAHAEEKDTEIQEVRDRAVAEADAARMAQMQSREEELSAMLAHAQASIANLQKLHSATQNQLFAIQSQSEDEHAGRQSELELASAELERAQERLASLEREKQVLVQQLAAPQQAQAQQQPQGGSTGGGGAASGGHPSLEDSLRQELSTQREMAARLRLELAAMRRDAEEGSSMLEAKVEGLRATLAATEQHAQALEEELAARPTQQQMEDLRQQLRVLQAIGYNTLEMEDDSAPRAPGSVSAVGPGAGAAGRGGAMGGSGGASSLESMLLAKNRHLEHELTMTRLKVVDTRQEADTALTQVSELEAQLSEREALVKQLEDDLLASRAAERRLAIGPNATSSSDMLRAGSSGNMGAGDAGGEDAEDGNASMVRVLCSQRDRFRARVHDLEEELTRARAELHAAKSDAAAARADNIALVERLRYVHSRATAPASGPSPRSAAVRSGGASGKDVEAGTEVERRYGRLYDEGINPFKEFKEQQKERQKTSMGFADKAMFMFAQLVFGNQSARLFTFVYLSIIHLLVFSLLLRMTHHSSNQLYEHQQTVLDNRHQVTVTMHHNDPVQSRLP